MKIALIGAGIAGMSAAFDLVKAGHDVSIYEASDQPGGLASGFKEAHWDWSVEKFYHHWFQSDAHMLGIIKELGLSDKVIFPLPVTVMYHNGKFYPFDSIPAALMYPGLGWGINKIRFGLVGLYLRFSKNWQSLEKVTVDQWMRKWAGDKVYEEMWEPMMIGKLGQKHSKEVNMAWYWARIKARTTRLGTFEGGFQHFCDLFAEKLQAMGVNIHYNTPVSGINATEGGQVTLLIDEAEKTFDKVLSTTSPRLMAKITPELPQDYLQGLLDLKNMGAVVMVVSLKHQLSKEGYYWYNLPKKAGFPFLALVEHTNYVSSEHFGGEHIIYCGDYLETDHENFELSKEELLEKFIPSFKRINPDFNEDWVIKSWKFQTKYAQPVPLVDHSKHIPASQTPLQGLYFANMSQVYP